MIDTKKSNIIYIIILAIIIPFILSLLFISQTREHDNMTIDYNKVFYIGDYNVKIADCIYSSESNQISFIYKVAPSTNVNVEPGTTLNSQPIIQSIILVNDKKEKKEIAFKSEKISEQEYKYVCNTIGNEFANIRINFYSKNQSYYDNDIIDQFGDVIKGEYHEGEELNYYIIVDIYDMTKVSADELTNFQPSKTVTTTTTTGITYESNATTTTFESEFVSIPKAKTTTKSIK